MIAPRTLPAPLQAWNRRWRVPEGLRSVKRVEELGRVLWPLRIRRLGPFAFQLNNSTRIVEYAWAFHVASLAGAPRVVEVGGGLSGLQFVMAHAGVRVTNVDPFEEYGGADYADVPAKLALHARLNRAFRTDVRLIRSTLPAAGLPPGSVDRIYSISVLEHLEPEALHATMASIGEVLRPGGLVVITLDLFLDLWPFTDVATNRFGRNMSVLDLVASSGLELVWGRQSELFGYPGFSVGSVLARLHQYYVGRQHPCLAQLLVLRKPGGESADTQLASGVLAAGA